MYLFLKRFILITVIGFIFLPFLNAKENSFTNLERLINSSKNSKHKFGDFMFCAIDENCKKTLIKKK